MNPVTLLLVFVIVWWLIFFMALPVGVKAQNETEEGVVMGTVPSAPEKPQLLKKALWTSVAAVVVTALYYFVATSGIISITVPPK